MKPTLKIIEAPRLKALIEETLKVSFPLTITELQQKLGDVALEDVRKAMYALVKEGVLSIHGAKKSRVYTLAKKNK